MISSTHGDVLKDLHDKLMERRQVFLKRSIELARKQAWYRSVALGEFRRNLLCWMLNAVVRTLKVRFCDSLVKKWKKRQKRKKKFFSKFV